RDGGGRAQAQSANAGDGGQVSEQPANADPSTDTARLPSGGAFTQAGKGHWHVVAGSGPAVGSGKAYTYTVEVEDGIDPASYGGDDAFAHMVQQTLADPRSWVGAGVGSHKVSLRRVDASYPNPSFRVSLTTPATDRRGDLCGYQVRYESSCYNPSAGRVVIDLARWVRGAIAFEGDLGLYRQYAINHEVGHALGNEHVGCPANGALAPVMMQQSFGVSDDYVWRLNQADPSNRTAVAKDGKTCRPNAWPNPTG
ncbi:MAG: DUF3152 domain-containing protein, partial [Sciscionella sp.]|nr:DUF3152 domain-containing protein [Sciscionella sp.]